MSAIRMPGLDITERTPGSFRVRVRLHPFFALSNTFGDELAALTWGCQNMERLRVLLKKLNEEGRLPSSSVNREAAEKLGIGSLIDGTIEQGKESPSKLTSLGDEILVHNVLDSYLAQEAREISAGYTGRARRLKDYFGNVPISTITSERLKTYIDERLAGKVGHGRSVKPAYTTKNREYQRNLRRRRLGIPIVPTSSCSALPSTGSVRHELKLFRQALKAYAFRDDAQRERFAPYIVTHPILCITLPSAGEPRKRRISDAEMTAILGKVSCPFKRAAILLATYMSIRRAEVVSLRIEDVDLSASTVLLRASTEPDPQRPGQMRKKRKTKTVERDVPLVPEALELLRKLCEGKSAGPLFTFKVSSLSQAFGRAAEVAGVRDVRFHDTRREALSWLHDVYGLTLEQLTMFSGHTDVKTLQKHYFKPSASKMAHAIAQKVGVNRNIQI